MKTTTKILVFILTIVVLSLAAIFFAPWEEHNAPAAPSSNVSEDEALIDENYCNQYEPDVCPDGCVVCPPCEICSSIQCRLEASCAAIGFDKNWYKEIDGKLVMDVRIDDAGTSDDNADDQICGIENCHGLEIECGSNPVQTCTEIYQLGDKCRQYAQCGFVDGVCQQIISAEFNTCKSCVQNCQTEFAGDSMAMFACESRCE